MHLNAETERAIRNGMRYLGRRGRTVEVSHSPDGVEACTRDTLAAMAHAAGFDVQIEVPAGPSGRIDVLVAGLQADMLIEVKRHLTKPHQVRRGLQQVDGYHRFRNSIRPNVPILTAWEMDRSVCDSLASLYDVKIMTPTQVCERIVGWAKGRQSAEAVERLATLQREVLVRKRVAELVLR